MIKLFSGTANQPLAQEVASAMNLQLSAIEIVRFENSEVRVMIQEDVKDATTVVIQPFSNPTDTNLVEFFLTCDALRRQEARRVIGVVPYFGYARQNIEHREGECVSANVIIRFMESIGFHKIFTVDMHDEATAGVFSIPFKNITALSTLSDAIKDHYNVKEPSVDDYVIASPDQGGIERARKFGISFFGDDDFHMAVTEKKRDNKRIHQSKALDLYGDVNGKTCILVDDIATSAGTLIHSAELCMKHGATKVVAAVTHHDFSPKAVERIMNSPIELFFTTNTIQLNEIYNFEKLREISVAPLIANDLAYLLR
ncbi:MAG: ribose-phosphate diphosphokinase [Patescibacteria group bacterium]